ncbi:MULTISPECIES: DUF202 domain-containing protein [Citrobacter]|uniref:DUF202 domain-containing protein n=1 Tax=Citrobacter telavivensis TaxID=2653932 RepID=A0A6L5EGK2_9ENTR|nr:MULTISPECIES: DUF202 domain-containing protein [Citrobacter]MPQ53805.1 DUF202 domain-containing protein [Citrobacter telavivensis]QFS72124.1 DUF202 domain-containing protein [Citrobacter telavivensis]CAI9390595.1 hypothetical protein CITSP_03612 [Citrobacter sp. T1.2D-1]
MSRDSGLQPERTELAWRRTGWSMLIPALLCLRGWIRSGHVLYALSGILLLIGTLTLLCGIIRGRYMLISLLVVLSGVILLINQGEYLAGW